MGRIGSSLAGTHRFVLAVSSQTQELLWEGVAALSWQLLEEPAWEQCLQPLWMNPNSWKWSQPALRGKRDIALPLVRHRGFSVTSVAVRILPW